MDLIFHVHPRQQTLNWIFVQHFSGEWNSPLKCSGMPHVSVESQFYLPLNTLIHTWNNSCLPLLPCCRVSTVYFWYVFSILLRIGGGVGLRGPSEYGHHPSIKHGSSRQVSQYLCHHPSHRIKALEGTYCLSDLITFEWQNLHICSRMNSLCVWC